MELTRDWALSLLARLGFVKRRATTKANKQLCEEKFQKVKRSYLNQIASIVHIHNIPAELVMNLDQTGINLVPAGNWTTAPQGSRRVALAGVGNKRQVTATFACTLSGAFLNMQLLYQGKTNRCHPKFDFPEGFDVHHSPNHWATEETSLRFIKKVIQKDSSNLKICID